MAIADRSAFPEHLNTKEKVEKAFPDDSQYEGHWWGRVWKWLNKSTKHWEAFGPRSPKGIAFTTLPVPILAIYALALVVYAVVCAFSPANFRWAFLIPFAPIPFARKWRDVPVVLWSEKKAGGAWRFESIVKGEPELWSEDEDPSAFLKAHPNYYLTRVQLWARNTRFLLWPLFWCQVRYKDTAEVIPVGEKQDRDGKIDIFYLGAKMDGDWLYWIWAFFRGENFK